MKIHKDIKPELATSDDASRPAIAETYLDIKDGKGVLVSTDGRIMAVTPVEITETDTSGFVGEDVFKAARKLTRQTAEIGLNGSATLTNGATMPREGLAKDNQFPNWRVVFPAPYEKPAMVIALDAKRLWQLAQAMGTQGVIITIKNPDAPFLISPISCGRYSNAAQPVSMDSRGVIMPVKVGAQS